ncbi:MAG TPA: glutathione S-transferase family protein [Steroidobacteraceae bacterium]|nr:glutathione S-transferase family protein [Steroidobacteraceae bacterium]
MTQITLTTFQWVPPFAQGLVRDLRVRWALEEAGLPYREKLLTPGEQNTPAYRALQPFGQVPVFEQDGLVMFESGAILMHIAEQSPALLPADAAGRSRVRTWMFAALNSVEPHVQNLVGIDLFHAAEEWAKARRPAAEKFAVARLDAVAAALGDREYLVDSFTVADLLMTTVLRFLRHSTLVEQHPVLGPYKARCEARPAFQRALAAQMANFVKYAPAA